MNDNLLPKEPAINVRVGFVERFGFGRLDEWPEATVPIASLIPADSPRVDGENADHVRLLAELAGETPPIVVHRSTMRVIDGMHRVRAALARGWKAITVRFFEGGERDLFVLALELNAGHGLPLSRADRTAAAARVMRSHPHRSDQMIAELVGLSGKTVATIRRRSTSEFPRLNGRLGRDGRIRPLKTIEGRRLAGRLLAERPEVALREVAREAGISLGTAQDVRKRLRSGLDPVPQQRRREPHLPRTDHVAMLPRPGDDAGTLELLRRLKGDPSLRFSDIGRKLLRLLDTLAVPRATWTQIADRVPVHSAALVAAVARGCADSWLRFAEQVDQHARRRM